MGILGATMSNVNLINEKNSKLDLSSVKDAQGVMVILQPKGAKGSQRECHADVLEHPHVQSFVKMKWLRYEDVSLKPVETKQVPVQSPAPLPPAPLAPPLVVEASVVERLVVEEALLLPESKTVTEHTGPLTSSETEDVGEQSSVTSSKKRNRRD